MLLPLLSFSDRLTDSSLKKKKVVLLHLLHPHLLHLQLAKFRFEKGKMHLTVRFLWCQCLISLMMDQGNPSDSEIPVAARIHCWSAPVRPGPGSHYARFGERDEKSPEESHGVPVESASICRRAKQRASLAFHDNAQGGCCLCFPQSPPVHF